ncbi:uncharacterized protein GLRG_07504 [Colletotrichum graminicola M1.001]|uniref:Uncharacterized protein n=1 Tax=Colletotrichum graminicola (strain M1.001 / M2 / FGSC 10212) TaxID=645133 RepID=E3QNC2_COLGM|nr:uncharacterized protein GLRG_07504 [Colletotrichum graminicola M1.001]EFQ32360.1 hypothetical protein GLRG_07504 [Colletotrichum graminicola M1.001]
MASLTLTRVFALCFLGIREAWELYSQDMSITSNLTNLSGKFKAVVRFYSADDQA